MTMKYNFDAGDYVETKSFCFHKINTQNIQESFIVDLGVISNKINELIAAVNELRENHE